MRNYIYVFFGGAAGGLLRALATHADNAVRLAGVDLTILAINLAGAFFLGLFLLGNSRFQSLSHGLRLGIAVGFFGSFTTFSTFCMESATLFDGDFAIGFLLYVFSSCILGLASAQLGHLAGKVVSLQKVKSVLRTCFVSGQQETEGD